MAQTLKPREAYANQFKAPDFTSNCSKEEAFLIILAAAVHADEHTRRVEEQELLALLGRTRTLHALNAADRRRLLEESTEAVRDSTRRNHSLENACAKLFEIDIEGSENDGVRASVFAHACDIIHADLELHEKEIPFLDYLYKKLRLSSATADEIKAAIKLKNLY
jgi:hypothetical protein